MVQVELHPGVHCDVFHCPFCFAKDHILSQDLLPLAEYDTLFSELKGQLEFVELSGIATDPLTYPEFEGLIRCILGHKLSFGIHTKGLRLTGSLAREIVRGDSASFITLSLHAPDAPTFNRVHQMTHDHTAFSRILENLRNFRKLRDQAGSAVRINLSYLLFRGNSQREVLSKFVEQFSELADCIRFSIPQVTHNGQQMDYLSHDEIPGALANARTLQSGRVIVLDYDDSMHKGGFTNCHAKRFGITVDKSGNVYPCPHVALPRFARIRYGDLRTQSITEILHSRQKKAIEQMPVQQMDCEVCSRRDESINCSNSNPHS